MNFSYHIPNQPLNSQSHRAHITQKCAIRERKFRNEINSKKVFVSKRIKKQKNTCISKVPSILVLVYMTVFLFWCNYFDVFGIWSVGSRKSSEIVLKVCHLDVVIVSVGCVSLTIIEDYGLKCSNNLKKYNN